MAETSTKAKVVKSEADWKAQLSHAFLAQGILIALLDRAVSGEGRWVQTSLIEAGLTLLDFQATRWTMDKKIPPQEGNNHPTNTPMGLFPTADGYLNIAATSNKNFQKFCKLIDREKMATDPRFGTTALRRQNKEAMNELIAAALRARTTAEWFELLVAEGLPCGPVYNIMRPSPIRRCRRCASSDRSRIRASANSIWWRNLSRSQASIARFEPQRPTSANTMTRSCNRWAMDRTRSQS